MPFQARLKSEHFHEAQKGKSQVHVLSSKNLDPMTQIQKKLMAQFNIKGCK